jgi:uncharacterized protein
VSVRLEAGPARPAPARTVSRAVGPLVALVVLVVLALLGAACGGAADLPSSEPATSRGDEAAEGVTGPVTGPPPLHPAIDGLPAARVVFDVVGGPAALDVRVAERVEDRAQGLKGVTSLPDGAGMLFLFPEPSPSGERGGFWMYETVVPLDIAFVAAGVVVGVATMQPCPAQPCPITHPGVAYDAAVETTAGWLSARGVATGTAVTWTGP